MVRVSGHHTAHPAAVTDCHNAIIFLFLGIGACMLQGSSAIRKTDEAVDLIVEEGNQEDWGETIINDPKIWGQVYKEPPNTCPNGTKVLARYKKTWRTKRDNKPTPDDCEKCEAIQNDKIWQGKLTWVAIQPNHIGSWAVDAFTHVLSTPDWKSELRGVPDEQNVKGTAQYAVFLYPLVDPNGGFRMTDQMCWRWECWRQQGYTTIVKRVRTPQEAMSLLKGFDDYSIGHLVLAGHGDRRSMVWSQDSADLLVEDEGPTKNMLKMLRTKLDHHATVFLDSCATAKSSFIADKVFRMRSFFKFVANNLPGRTVSGSDKPFSYRDLEFYKEGEGNVCEVKGVKILSFKGLNLDYHNRMKTRKTPPFCKELPRAKDWPESWDGETLCLGPCQGKCKDVTRDDECVIDKAPGKFFETRWESNCNIGWRMLCVAYNTNQ